MVSRGVELILYLIKKMKEKPKYLLCPVFRIRRILLRILILESVSDFTDPDRTHCFNTPNYRY